MSENTRGETFQPKPVTNRESIQGGHDLDEAARQQRDNTFDVKNDDVLADYEQRLKRQNIERKKLKKQGRVSVGKGPAPVVPVVSEPVSEPQPVETQKTVEAQAAAPVSSPEAIKAQREHFLSIIQGSGFLSDEEMQRYKDYDLSELSNTAQSFLDLENLGMGTQADVAATVPTAPEGTKDSAENNTPAQEPAAINIEPIVDKPTGEQEAEAKPDLTHEDKSGAPSIPTLAGRPKTPEELRADMLAARDLVPRGWEEVYDLKKSLEAKYGLLPTLGLGDKDANLQALKRLEKLAARLPADMLVGRRFKLGKVGAAGNAGFLVIDMALDDKDQLSKWLFDPELASGEVDELNPETDENREDPDLVIPTRPVSTPAQTTPSTETPPTPEQLAQQELESLRVNYVAAKKALDKYNSLGLLRRHLKSDESKQRVTEAFETAKNEYYTARAEYVGVNSMHYINEQRALAVSRAEEYGTLERNAIEKTHDLWVKMGDLNLNTLYRHVKGRDIENRALKFTAKALSTRALVSATLLGAGLYGGAGIAGGAMVARRVWSGLGSGLGTRGLIESVRRGRNSKALNAETIANLGSVAEVEDRLSALTAKTYFDGNKIDQLVQSDEYTMLEDRLKQLLDAEVNPADAESTKQLFEQQFGKTETLVAQKINKEKNARRMSTVAGAAVGAFVGSGAMAKAVNYFLGDHATTGPNAGGSSSTTPGSPEAPKDPDAAYKEFMKQADDLRKKAASAPSAAEVNVEPKPFTPLTPNQELDQSLYESKVWDQPTAKPFELGVQEEILHRGKPSGATLEMLGNESIVHAGSRGLEGAILDLKHTEPEKYKAVIDWLHKEYPGTEAKDSTLVHRMMTKLAHEKGFGIDSGAKDLSQIDAGAIKINADGSFSLEDGSIKFSSTSTAAEAATEQGPEDYVKEITKSAENIGPENIETEKLDFVNLQPSRSAEELAGLTEQARDNFQGVTRSDYVNKVLEEAHSKFQDMNRESELYEVYKSVEKLKASDALKTILDKDYRAFMKDTLQLDTRELNKIQTLKVSEFNDFYTHAQASPAQQREYKGLYDSLTKLLGGMDKDHRDMILKQPIKQALVRLATQTLLEKK